MTTWVIAQLCNSGLPPAEAEAVAQHFNPKQYEEGEYFVKEGQLNDKLGMVAQGAFQYTITLGNDEEVTTYISTQGGFLVSINAYTMGQPARENIIAIAPSQVWSIGREAVKHLIAEQPGFAQFYIGLLEHTLYCIDMGKQQLLTMTAAQRYEQLLKEEPELLQLVPQYKLAPMLGVTPRHLSRIRAKKA